MLTWFRCQNVLFPTYQPSHLPILYKNPLNYIVVTIWPVLCSACLSITPTEKTKIANFSAHSNLLIRSRLSEESNPVLVLITRTYNRHNLQALRMSLLALTGMFLDREYKRTNNTLYMGTGNFIEKLSTGNALSFAQNFFCFHLCV